MAYKDKQKQKEASRRHYLKNKKKIIERTAKWKKNNPEAAKQHCKNYNNKESEEEGVTQAAFNKGKWRDANKEQNKIINKKWRDANKDEISAYNKKYYINKSNK